MSQQIRRSLAVGLLTAFFLALPVPSQAAGLLNPAATSVWVARGWSWLEGLGLAPAVPRKPVTPWEKANGTASKPATTQQTAPPSHDEQGSGIDPNGVR